MTQPSCAAISSLLWPSIRQRATCRRVSSPSPSRRARTAARPPARRPRASARRRRGRRGRRARRRRPRRPSSASWRTRPPRPFSRRRRSTWSSTLRAVMDDQQLPEVVAVPRSRSNRPRVRPRRTGCGTRVGRVLLVLDGRPGPPAARPALQPPLGQPHQGRRSSATRGNHRGVVVAGLEVVEPPRDRSPRLGCHQPRLSSYVVRSIDMNSTIAHAGHPGNNGSRENVSATGGGSGSPLSVSLYRNEFPSQLIGDELMSTEIPTDGAPPGERRPAGWSPGGTARRSTSASSGRWCWGSSSAWCWARGRVLEVPSKLILRLLGALAPMLDPGGGDPGPDDRGDQGRHRAAARRLLVLNTTVAIVIGLTVANVVQPGTVGGAGAAREGADPGRRPRSRSRAGFWASWRRRGIDVPPGTARGARGSSWTTSPGACSGR